MADENAKVAEFVRLESPEARLPAICERTRRCCERGLTVAVRLATRGEAGRLDEQMWTFQEAAFIPHVLLGEAEEPVIEPVVIYCEDQPLGEADVLIHAAGGEPGDWFRPFNHVIDFAELYDEALREAGRRRYAAYKDAGYRMRYIQ